MKNCVCSINKLLVAMETHAMGDPLQESSNPLWGLNWPLSDLPLRAKIKCQSESSARKCGG